MSYDLEEVKTYSELVSLVREELMGYMSSETSRFREVVAGLKRPSPLKVDPGLGGYKVVAAVDGGSGIISLADRQVGFAAALAVIDNGKGYTRRVARPRIIVQLEGEGDGEFQDRLDITREEMMLELASRLVGEVDLLLVDGPLIPRPEYGGEYLLQLRRLLSKSRDGGVSLMGFVKRPQSRFLDELSAQGLSDRAVLSALLERLEAYPWPPRQRVQILEEPISYTYLRLMDPPTPSVFRIDVPSSVGVEELTEMLSYVAATSDPEKGIPALLAKADEEVKMSRRLMKDLYRECFETASRGVEPRLWSPLAPKWGEGLW